MSSNASQLAPLLSTPPVKNFGWSVTFAGMGINLALGVLYSWSVIKKDIPAEWNWNGVEKMLPYALACLVFSIVMVPAGRMQDKFGPRLVASIGGILVGAGLVLTCFTTSAIGYMIGFGLLAGAGIGFGYASATPPAVKWFPKQRTGLIAGIVVSGFGLAGVYVSPLLNWMIADYGIPTTVLILGIGFLFVVVALAQLLKSPPAGYVPAAPHSGGKSPSATASVSPPKGDMTPKEMLVTWQFWILWFMYICGAGAGLMIISSLAEIAKVQAGLSLGFLLVAILAIGNGGGRIVAGMVSDRIGRKATLRICFVLQAIMLLVLNAANKGSAIATVPILCLISALIGANYGANLAIFPAITKDYYGLKHFGMNYGLIFTAWGVGGCTLSVIAGLIYSGYIGNRKGSFEFAYYTAVAMLIMAAIIVSFVRPPHRKQANAIESPAVAHA
ncbi:MAG: OFA family MFS transporter [Planctomycetes bacterium]|nr:OFA family MFS transporter [Planctomycetota bacterium]